jgi:hypothetical protein
MTHVPVEEVAVGTEIALRLPPSSRRALLTHRAPTLDGDEEPLLWPRMQDAWKRRVPVVNGPRNLLTLGRVIFLTWRGW